jgi:hypothetical protein
MGEDRVILIGESNPYGADPEFALYDYPVGCAGHRLRRVLGLSSDQYLALHRVNLCDDDFSRVQAEKRALELMDARMPWRVMVLLGRKVTAAFEKIALGGHPLLAFEMREHPSGRTLVSLPHPSGRNLVWNQPSARARAREILRTLAPELPWGSAEVPVEACA